MSELLCVRRTVRAAIVALALSAVSAVAASAQIAADPQPSAAASDTQFDNLNSRLAAAADGLLNAPVATAESLPAAVNSATPPMVGAALPALASIPEQHSRADLRVERLRPIIDPIFRSEGVPVELAAVAIVESGGQPMALSPKGARGLWQLMPETARRYGLTVSAQRDERLDVVTATRAAARYLHDLYAQFGDWQLALAAYNAGEQAVSSAMQRARSNSFTVLSGLHLLPAETRKYVPAVMSASGPLRQLTADGESATRKLAAQGVFYALIAPAAGD